MRAEEGLPANSDTQVPTSKIGRYSGRLEGREQQAPPPQDAHVDKRALYLALFACPLFQAPPRDSQLRRPDQDHHQDTHTPQRIASGDSTLRRSCLVRPQVTSMRRRRSVTTRTDFQQVCRVVKAEALMKLQLSQWRVEKLRDVSDVSDNEEGSSDNDETQSVIRLFGSITLADLLDYRVLEMLAMLKDFQSQFPIMGICALLNRKQKGRLAKTRPSRLLFKPKRMRSLQMHARTLRLRSVMASPTCQSPASLNFTLTIIVLREQYKTKIAELKELEVSQDQYLKDFALCARQEV